jgi:hypothetical protein
MSKYLVLAVSVVLVGLGCGGSGGVGRNLCSVTVTGDTASGVGTNTYVCGTASTATTVEAPTESIFAGHNGIIDIVWPNFSANPPNGFFRVVYGGVPIPVNTTLTKAVPNGDDAVSAGYLHSVSLSTSPPTSQAWTAASDTPFGDWELIITSATQIDVSICANIYVSYLPNDCYLVHGSAHITLVPDTELPNNTAAGTVTFDVTF